MTDNKVIVTKERKKRSRTTFNSEQLMSLEKHFRINHYVNRQGRIEIANNLSLPEKQIKIWFQNRRMKHKKEVQHKIATRSTKSSTERIPSYTLDTTHQTSHNIMQSSMWTIPDAISASNIHPNHELQNSNHGLQNSNQLTTTSYENINRFQQQIEQNYFQPAIESVAMTQMQLQSSYNVLQDDTFSPYNQYVSYQTDYSDTTCSQQEMCNYQQQWDNYIDAQNINFFNENFYINSDNNYSYNNMG